MKGTFYVAKYVCISLSTWLLPFRYTARVIRSERAGMGKSLYVNRLTSKLEQMLNQSDVTYPLCVTIPVHGPTVNFDIVMKSLQRGSNFDDLEYSTPQIFHFDIASSVRIVQYVIHEQKWLITVINAICIGFR